MQQKSTRFLLLTVFLILALVPCFGARAPKPPKAPVFRATFLDVGQGDAILLQTAEKVILIDAGDDRANAANASIIPFCKKEGIKKIDVAVISHPHRDHFGGYIDLLQAMPIGEFLISTDALGSGDSEESGNDVLLYQKMYDIIKEKGIPYKRASLDQKIDWGKGVKVEVLHVAEGVFAMPSLVEGPTYLPDIMGEVRAGSETSKISANEQSLVFKVTVGKVSYLFTGDAEKGAEAKVVQNFRDKLPCTILKSGHHGSRTSSSNPLMELAKPDYGVISVGKYNSFKHPNTDILEKYAYFKMKVFRTDEDGTIDSYTDGETVRFVSNQSPLEFSIKPSILSLTDTSATVQWGTNKPSNTQIFYGIQGTNQNKVLNHAVTNHTITLTGLKPATTYVFKAVSQDARQPDQVIEIEGSFKTLADDGTAVPKIQSMAANTPAIYMRKPFEVQIQVKNADALKTDGISLDLYHTSITEETKLGHQSGISIPAKSKTAVVFPVELTWLGSVDLLAVLKKDGKIIDTSILNIQVLSKIILVDCAHGNIDFYTGKFAGMKMDLNKAYGFEFKSNSKPFSFEYLKDAFVLAIPDPEKEFSADELAALKEYVSKGGSVVMFSRADYGNRSHPQILNTALSTIGSSIRFNDDEFCDPTNNIGAPWNAMMHVFPSEIIKEVKTILIRNPCSLINSKMKGLVASKNVHLFMTGDEDCYNLDADAMNDAFFYASQTTKLPIPVVAGEDLGFGRVACYGEPLYDDKLYAPTAQMQVPQFNMCIVKWLAESKEKTLKEILQYADRMNVAGDPELSAMRFEAMKGFVCETVETYLRQGDAETVREAFQGETGKGVESLKTTVRETLKFKSMHGEADPAVVDLLRDL